MSISKRPFRPAQKVAILREHLENDVSISTICEKCHLYPNNIYRWKKQLFEGAFSIFASGKDKKDKEKIQRLEFKLKERDEVISEIIRENIELKKS